MKTMNTEQLKNIIQKHDNPKQVGAFGDDGAAIYFNRGLENPIILLVDNPEDTKNLLYRSMRMQEMFKEKTITEIDEATLDELENHFETRLFRKLKREKKQGAYIFTIEAKQQPVE